MVRHQWQQLQILLELLRWPNDEKQKSKLVKIIVRRPKGDPYIEIVIGFASNEEINIELSPMTKEFVERVHHAYVMHLKVFVRQMNIFVLGFPVKQR